MPKKLDSIPINNQKLDRRVKLLDFQREVASAYGVSRRTIQFIWHPEKLEENKKRRAERGGSKQYYNREESTIAKREHREYKEQLYKNNLI